MRSGLTKHLILDRKRYAVRPPGAPKNQRGERWPKELAVEQEVIEPEGVKENPEAFRCLGEEATKAVVGIHVVLTRSLFGGGILRSLLPLVSLAKPTSAPLRC